jgi:hypothetical protein
VIVTMVYSSFLWNKQGILIIVYFTLFLLSLWRMETKGVSLANHVLTQFILKVTTNVKGIQNGDKN